LRRCAGCATVKEGLLKRSAIRTARSAGTEKEQKKIKRKKTGVCSLKKYARHSYIYNLKKEKNYK